MPGPPMGFSPDIPASSTKASPPAPGVYRPATRSGRSLRATPGLAVGLGATCYGTGRAGAPIAPIPTRKAASVAKGVRREKAVLQGVLEGIDTALTRH
jgi:hypothetical protein